MADSKQRVDVCLALADLRNCTVGEMASCTGVTREVVEDILNELAVEGIVSTIRASGRKVHYNVESSDRLQKLNKKILETLDLLKRTSK